MKHRKFSYVIYTPPGTPVFIIRHKGKELNISFIIWLLNKLGFICQNLFSTYKSYLLGMVAIALKGGFQYLTKNFNSKNTQEYIAFQKISSLHQDRSATYDPP